MKRKFATNLILLLVLNLLVKPFWIFGIDRTVQNIVGAGEYGLFYSLFNFSLLFNIILDLGLTSYNNREISRHSQLLSKYLSNIVVLKFTLSILYTAFCLGVALIMGYDRRQVFILLFLVINQFLSSFILYFRSNLSGLQLFKTDSILSVLDRVLMIAICSLLIWGSIFNIHFTIEWFVFAQTGSYMVTFLVAFLLVYLKTDFFNLRFDRTFLLSIIRQSYPFAILALLMNIYSRIDSVMLERILPGGNVESGIYAQAFRIVDALNMVPFLFAGLLLPILSKMIKHNESVQSFIGFAFSLLFLPAFAFSVSCIAYRYDIMQILYHLHATESSQVLGILMASFLLISITYIFGTLLTANGNIKYLNTISLAGVVISISINLLLIPYYKSLGSAIANLITQLVIVILQVVYSFKIFKFQVSFHRYRNYPVFIILSIGFVIFIKMAIANWLWGITLSLVGIYTIGILLKLIRIRELFRILLYEKD